MNDRSSKRALRRRLAGHDYGADAATASTGPNDVSLGASLAAGRIALFARQLLWGMRRVGIYSAMPGEVDTQKLVALLRGDGCTIYLPRTVGRGDAAKLEFVATPPDAPLRRHPGGMLEPATGPGAAPPTPLAQLDAVVVPGVAFDLAGGRLGQGWGCYDRALADYAGLVVALAHARQICAAIPREPHDRQVDVVVTPFGVRPTRA